jgi:hypothetical protein
MFFEPKETGVIQSEGSPLSSFLVPLSLSSGTGRSEKEVSGAATAAKIKNKGHFEKPLFPTPLE